LIIRLQLTGRGADVQLARTGGILITGTVLLRRGALLIIALTFAGHATATPISVDWARSLLFSVGGGLENALLRVAFNPQPEPPAAGQLSFADPTTTGYPPDPIITHSGA